MENFDSIQRYLGHKMSTEESQQFEQEVLQNEELAMELEVQRFEMETIEQIEEDALREKLLQTSSSDELEQTSNVRQLQPARKNTSWILTIAASVVLLAGFFFFQNSGDQRSNLTADVYDEVRIDYSRGSIVRGDGTEPTFPARYTDILRNWNTNMASEAISFFANYSSGDKIIEAKALLNLGHAYVLNDQFAEAISSFSKVRMMPEATRELMEEASFFEAIAHLQSENKSEAIQLLNTLADEGQNFDAIAKTALKKIEAK